MIDNSPDVVAQVDAQNVAVIANMIDLSTETVCKISDDYIDVGNEWKAKREVADAIGANLLTAILKQAGV